MKESLWVVTSSTPTATGFAQECFDDSAKSTTIRSKWARFDTHPRAVQWCNTHGIDVNDLTCQIVQCDFSEFDMAKYNSAP